MSQGVVGFLWGLGRLSTRTRTSASADAHARAVTNRQFPSVDARASTINGGCAARCATSVQRQLVFARQTRQPRAVVGSPSEAQSPTDPNGEVSRRSGRYRLSMKGRCTAGEAQDHASDLS